jgi:hypothetical protein
MSTMENFIDVVTTKEIYDELGPEHITFRADQVYVRWVSQQKQGYGDLGQ